MTDGKTKGGERPKIAGLCFLLGRGLLSKVNETQNRNGQPVVYADVDYLGGSLHFNIDPIQNEGLANDLCSFRGKEVALFGKLKYQVQQFGRNVQTDVGFELLHVGPPDSI